MLVVTGAVLLDRYRIIVPHLRRDAYPPTALAVDQRFGRQVDLVLAPAPFGSPVGERFARRAQAVALLEHPALPPVLDLGLHDGYSVLVYPHIEGCLLAEVAAYEPGTFTTRRALETVASLAAALGLAHARGLCHGSFGAKSVLVDGDGFVTILDLCWPTPAIMERRELAPELWSGRDPTTQADVFALGRILHSLTRRPGTASDRRLAGAAEEVVRRATAWAPQQRYADGAALARALGGLLATEPSDWPIAAPGRLPITSPGRTSSAAPGRTPVAAPGGMPIASSGRTPVTRHVWTATPAARRARPVAPRRNGLLPALVLGLAMGLPPVAGIVLHHAMAHRPFFSYEVHGDWHDGPPPWWDQGRANGNGTDGTFTP